jgi:hypothetical protein
MPGLVTCKALALTASYIVVAHRTSKPLLLSNTYTRPLANYQYATYLAVSAVCSKATSHLNPDRTTNVSVPDGLRNVEINVLTVPERRRRELSPSTAIT